MRRNASLVLVVCAVMATVASAHYPAKVKVDVAAKKQPPVEFDHANHGDRLVKTCDTCHHTNKGLAKAQAGKVQVKKCSECHLDPKGGVPSMREASPTKNPLHARCISCHKAEKKGPVACAGCHKKAA